MILNGESKLKLKFGLVLVGFIFLIFSFQNCSTSLRTATRSLDSLLAQSESLSTTDKGGGDGTGFEGKLTAAYIRTLPSLSCQSSVEVKNEHTYQWLSIDQNSHQAFVSTVNSSTCQANTEVGLNSKLEASNLQSQILVYKNSIFYSENITEKNNNFFIEAFCFDNEISDATIQIALRVNYLANFTEIKFWKKHDKEVSTNQFLVANRSVVSTWLNYSNEYFDISIDTERMKTGANSYKADLNLFENGKSVSKNVTCRLGGEYDGRIWPAEMLDEKKVHQFKKLKNNNLIFITEDNKLLLKNQATNAVEILLTDFNFQKIYRFNITDQEDKIIFTGKAISSEIKNLYQYDLRTKELRQLNGVLTQWQEGVEDDFLLSPDSNFVIYRDGQKLLPGKSDLESKYLKSVSLQTFKVTQLHPNLEPDLEVNVFIPFGHDLIFFKIYNDLYINNYAGTNYKKISLSSLGIINSSILDIYYSDGTALVSKLFNKDRIQTPWTPTNAILNDFLMIPVVGSTFQTLKLKGEQLSLLTDKAILYDILYPEIFLGKDIANNSVMSRNGETIHLSSSIADYHSDSEAKTTYLINTDINENQSMMSQLTSTTEKKLLLSADIQKFMVMPRSFLDAVMFWQYDPVDIQTGEAGFHLEILDNQGQVKKIPKAFIRANHLSGFKILPGFKKAIVLAAHIDTNDYTILSDMKNVDWNIFQPTYDLYIVSLDGSGIQRINPLAEVPHVGVQDVWPINDEEIYFSMGTSTDTNQVYLWKQKN